MSSTKLKPLYLMDIFRQLTDAEHRLTVPELVEELQTRGIRAERKGLYRDIAALREYGADIRHSGGGYYLAERDFATDDLRALSLAVQSADFLSGRRTQELLEKLRILGGKHQGKKLIQGTVTGGKWPDGELLRTLEILDSAIGERRQVTFALRNGSQGDGRLRMSPYALLFTDMGCFLAGSAEGADNVSCVPVKNISAVRADMTPWRHFSEVSPYKTEFDCRDFLENAARISGH